MKIQTNRHGKPTLVEDDFGFGENGN